MSARDHAPLSQTTGMFLPWRGVGEPWSSFDAAAARCSVSLHPQVLPAINRNSQWYISHIDWFRESVTTLMLHELAYIGSFSMALNAMMSGAGDTTMALSLLPSLIGLCLLGLLIFGGLWFRRLRPYGFRRNASRDSGLAVAAYDYVTGLPTRRLFETLLDQAVGRAVKTGRPLTVLVVELEHFRMVAESQGQANSNALVRVQAARVKGVLRSMDTVARLTPEQFAVIADNLTSHQEVTAIVEKLQATVGLPLTLDGHEFFLTCRIGIARYPDDATEQKGLISQALQAVKHAKSHGQAVQYSSPETHANTHEPAQPATSFADLLP